MMAQPKYLLSDIPRALREVLQEHQAYLPSPPAPPRTQILATLRKWARERSEMRLLAAVRAGEPCAVWARLVMSRVEFEARADNDKARRALDFLECDAQLIRELAARAVEHVPKFSKKSTAPLDRVLMRQLRSAFDEAIRNDARGPYLEVRNWLDEQPPENGGPRDGELGHNGQRYSFSPLARYLLGRIGRQRADSTIRELLNME